MSTDETDDRSLMETTGLGLLPGVALATLLVVTVMAVLLTGSMWAVAGVLVVVIAAAVVVVFVVLAVSAEGEEGRRLRRKIPGLSDPDA